MKLILLLLLLAALANRERLVKVSGRVRKVLEVRRDSASGIVYLRLQPGNDWVAEQSVEDA